METNATIAIAISSLSAEQPCDYSAAEVNRSTCWRRAALTGWGATPRRYTQQRGGMPRDCDSSGCEADMAEGSAEEEQSSTAAPASPPADLRILNTQLSTSYQQQQQLQQQQQQQQQLQQQLQHQHQSQQQQSSRPPSSQQQLLQLQQRQQHPSMLATAVPPRHSLLPHHLKAEIKSEAEMDSSCDVPLNLKSEVSNEMDYSTPLFTLSDIAAVSYSNGPQSSDSLLNGKDSLDSDRSSTDSPEPGSGSLSHEHQLLMEGLRNSRKRRRSPSPKNIDHAKRAAVAQAHLNGTMAGMVTLQNLQNLAMAQNLPQVASFAAGLQGMSSELTNNQLINAPLNLTVTPPAGTAPTTPSCTTAPMATLTQLLAQPQPVAMPQFIMTSGQLVQGIQGAQLLIPTSQGIATQTILTIPVSHVSTSNQIVNLALSNGQVVSTTLANLQSIAQPQGMMNTPTNNVPTSPSLGPSLGINPAALPHLLSNNTASQQLLSAMQPQQLLQAAQAQAQAVAQQQAVSQQQQQQQQPLLAASPPQHSHRHQSHINHYAQQQSEKHHRDRVEQSSPLNGSAVSAATALNRLAASNGEITITTSHGPQGANVKASPSSVHSVKDDDDDLLNDSSNQPTINEATNNVVDGINLDEIKEFAKAFKLRRLSLGLTQTQVGQALSVTEGPAYSQSAICRFEKLDITPKSAVKIKPVLETWMKEAEDSAYDYRYKSGANHLTDFIGVEPSKKRKRRTSFTPQALELLNAHFDRNTHPSGNEITALAQQLGYDREVIRIWFCNKRQALKNTVRMMSKNMSS
ncbi:POU domain, class 6, transcription factor 1 isoform X3 [Phymastichus coffea]|uniref:POU domain, class 6, transcription factor 1 isoform X3 n=1 Tax=Phymastichus coffea TaxID=108790 RepID=UPI00273A848D|nr:POU domain, class 6, transcription factor 1 isoform X3 [Phymastichus coffea]